MNLLAFLLACSGSTPLEPEYPEPTIHKKTVFSSKYSIEQKYRSMRGPSDIEEFQLLRSTEPELVWITGYETTMVDATSQEEISQEWMCHANLDMDAKRYYDEMDATTPISGRLFTLSQGQQLVEFPRGFGIPFNARQPLSLATQVLNLNIDEPDLEVRHKVTVNFVRDAELSGYEFKPLFQGAVEGFKALEVDNLYYGESDPDPESHGQGCSVGSSAIDGDVDLDRLGRKFTAHWVVKPGREENRTLVTNFLNLRFDTEIHYIAVHLHPFAEFVELIDLTSGKTVYKSKVTAADGRVGIERVEHFESEEGLPVFADHEYELLSVYNNTSDEDADSMAVMFMYMRDKQFKKPAFASKPVPAG